MSEYIPVPVDAAREISRRFGKEIVVIVSYDRTFGQVHTTTYGREAADKTSAAHLGEILAKAAGAQTVDGSLVATQFEDFRTRTAAEWAQEKDRLLARIRELEDLA